MSRHAFYCVLFSTEAKKDVSFAIGFRDDDLEDLGGKENRRPLRQKAKPVTTVVGYCSALGMGN